jgi:uncharacterized OB-fold protein
MITIAGAAAALMASTALAFAVDDTGVITNISWAIGTISLDNGRTYVLPPSVQSATQLAVGMKVKLSQEQNIIYAISKA